MNEFKASTQNSYFNCALCSSKEEGRQVIKKEIKVNNNFFLIEVVQCLNCRLVFDCSDINSTDLNHYITDEYYKEKKIGSRIDKRFIKHFKNRALLHINFLSDFFSPGFTGKVLDIGCGAGMFLHEMRALGWDVYGVEPSRDHYIYSQKNLNLKVFNGLFDDYKIDIEFDLIYLSHIFDDLSNIKYIINRIKQLLSDKGVVFIEVPNFSRKNKLEINDGDLIENSFYYTCDTLVSILDKNGLKVSYVDTFEPIYSNTFIQQMLFPFNYLKRLFLSNNNKSHIRVICKKN